MDENGPIENLQVIVCVAAVILFVIGSRFQFKKGYLDQTAISLFLSMIPFVGAGRELSFGRVLGVSDVNVSYTKYVVAAIVACTLLLALVFLAMSILRGRLHFGEAFFGQIFFYISAFSIVFAQLLEKGRFGLPRSEALEESFELIGYIFLFYLSLHRVVFRSR